MATHTTPLNEAKMIDIVYSLTFHVRENNNLYVIPDAGYIYLGLNPDLPLYSTHQKVKFTIVDDSFRSTWRKHEEARRLHVRSIRTVDGALSRLRTTFNISAVSKAFNVKMVQEGRDWFFIIEENRKRARLY